MAFLNMQEGLPKLTALRLYKASAGSPVKNSSRASSDRLC
jgi:hypothetical protein